MHIVAIEMWFSNANWNHSNQTQSIRMQILTIQKGFEPFERDSKHSNANSNHLKGIRSIHGACKFETFKKDSKHSNENLNPLNEIRSIRMQILTIRKGFKAFQYKFESFERDSNHSNANSNHCKGFKPFECKFEPFEGDSKHSNANANHLKEIRRIRMPILSIRTKWEAFKSKF